MQIFHHTGKITGRAALHATIVLFSLLLLSAKPLPHAIYLSVVEVDRKDISTPAVVRIKVFADDMEDALANQSGTRMTLLNPAGCLPARPAIENYFQQYLSLAVNEEPVKLELTHCEPVGDALLLYFQTTQNNPWRTITVSATFLMELFPSQSNVLSVYYGQEKRFAHLNKSKSATTFRF